MHGCNGHMGQVITNLLKKDTQAQIVAGIDPFDEGKNEYPVFSSIDKCDVEADVLILLQQRQLIHLLISA